MVAVTVEPDVTRGPVRARTRAQLARVSAVVAMLDATVVIGVVPLALAAKFGRVRWPSEGILWFTGIPAVDFGFLAPLWLVSMAVFDTYSRRKFARSSDEFKTVLRVSIAAGGREFGLWKFHSMIPGAGNQHAELVETAATGVLQFKVQSDACVTRVGRFLRRASLDEPSQLLNVLHGEMSMVVPRPRVAEEVALRVDADHRRLMVRPGITGVWQVSGRSDLKGEESVRLDLSYGDNWSMSGDLLILSKTVKPLLLDDGAY